MFICDNFCKNKDVPKDILPNCLLLPVKTSFYTAESLRLKSNALGATFKCTCAHMFTQDSTESVTQVAHNHNASHLQKSQCNARAVVLLVQQLSHPIGVAVGVFKPLLVATQKFQLAFETLSCSGKFAVQGGHGHAVGLANVFFACVFYVNFHQ